MKVDEARKIARLLEQAADSAQAAGSDDISLISVLDATVGEALDSLQQAINDKKAEQG